MLGFNNISIKPIAESWDLVGIQVQMISLLELKPDPSFCETTLLSEVTLLSAKK